MINNSEEGQIERETRNTEARPQYTVEYASKKQYLKNLMMIFYLKSLWSFSPSLQLFCRISST